MTETLRPNRSPSKTRRSLRKCRSRVTAAASVSWMALVAATSLGVAHVEHLRAHVTGDSESKVRSSDALRLIVQAYLASDLAPNGVPLEHARPSASAQRAVTQQELAEGVSVDLVALMDEQWNDQQVVIAWVEEGEANLDFDALAARPSEGVEFGAARVVDRAQIQLSAVRLECGLSAA